MATSTNVPYQPRRKSSLDFVLLCLASIALGVIFGVSCISSQAAEETFGLYEGILEDPFIQNKYGDTPEYQLLLESIDELEIVVLSFSEETIQRQAAIYQVTLCLSDFLSVFSDDPEDQELAEWVGFMVRRYLVSQGYDPGA